MFEKEAEECIMDCVCKDCSLYEKCKSKEHCTCKECSKDKWQNGAEFGYNKANEWDYVKDGYLPEENQWVLVYDGSYTVCNYHSNTPIKWLDNYENEVYEGSIIAWKEIVPPNENKKETDLNPDYFSGGW